MRITKKKLLKKAEYLSKITRKDFYINCAYNNYALYETIKGGGDRNVFNYRTSCKELYNMINSYVKGIQETMLSSIEV